MKQKNITIKMPLRVAKEFKNRINKGMVEGIEFVDLKEQGKEATVELSSDIKIDDYSMSVGFQLNENKFAAAAIEQARRIEKEKSKAPKTIEPIELEFISAIRKEFTDLYSELFKVVKQVASQDGKTTKFYFDVSDIVGRSQLVARIYEIVLAAASCSINERAKQEHIYIQQTIRDLERCNAFTQTHIEYLRVSGKELIEAGYCTAFDSDLKPAKNWQRVLNILFGKRSKKYDYVYMNMIVDEAKQYVVKLKNPMPLTEPKDINHVENVMLIFDFGNQVYAGYGVKLVEKYAQKITRLHNEAVDASRK
jgi:hypothetical protein